MNTSHAKFSLKTGAISQDQMPLLEGEALR